MGFWFLHLLHVFICYRIFSFNFEVKIDSEDFIPKKEPEIFVSGSLKFLAYALLSFSSAFFFDQLVHSTNPELATKIDEYVPINIPAISASRK